MTPSRVEKLQGVEILTARLSHDARGSSFGLDVPSFFDMANHQISSLTSFNSKKGTIRGLHFQTSPSPQSKIIWCLAGGIFDVLVDVRPQSTTFGCWMAVEIQRMSELAIAIPPFVAHGYQTLADSTLVAYLLSGSRSIADERTLFWRDADLDIPWPLPVSQVSPSDQAGQPWSSLTQ